MFLYYLEKLVGGTEEFLPYVRDYVKTYRGKSLDTEDWKRHFLQYWQTHNKDIYQLIMDKVDFEVFDEHFVTYCQY